MASGYDYTQGVRDVLVLAREEALRLQHEYIGTEHLLLGLLRTPDDTSAALLRALSVNVANVRDKVDRVVKRGRAGSPQGELPHTSRGKKALELAIAASQELGHARVGTEHLLLGLVRERNGIGGQMLIDAAVTEDAALNAISLLRRS